MTATRGLTSRERCIVASVMKIFCQRVDSAVNNPYGRNEASVKKRQRSRFEMWRAGAAFGLFGRPRSTSATSRHSEHKFLLGSILMHTVESWPRGFEVRSQHSRSVSRIVGNAIGFWRRSEPRMTALTFNLIGAPAGSIAGSSRVPRCGSRFECRIFSFFSRIVFQGEVSRRGGIA